MATMKTMATVKSYENEVNENYSITSKTGTTRAPTSRPQSTTPMTTLTSTIAWRTCTESARAAHLFHSCDCLTLAHLMAQVLSAFHIHPWSSTWRTLFDSFLPVYFHLFLLSVPVFLFHLELLHYTIVMANLRCSAAEESEDTLIPSPLSQVMSPTS